MNKKILAFTLMCALPTVGLFPSWTKMDKAALGLGVGSGVICAGSVAYLAYSLKDAKDLSNLTPEQKAAIVICALSGAAGLTCGMYGIHQLVANQGSGTQNNNDPVTSSVVYTALGLAAGEDLSKLDVAKINKLRGNDEFKSPLNVGELDAISENIADLLKDKTNTVENIVNAVKVQLNDLATIHRN